MLSLPKRVTPVGAANSTPFFVPWLTGSTHRAMAGVQPAPGDWRLDTVWPESALPTSLQFLGMAGVGKQSHYDPFHTSHVLILETLGGLGPDNPAPWS